MSKLETLLGMVDSISTRSNELIHSVSESNSLMTSISDLSHSITSSDAAIDDISELINKNNVYLAEFQKLYEKSFLLEANLHLNDCYTNEMSYRNLNKEYSYLWNNFDTDNAPYPMQIEKSSPKRAEPQSKSPGPSPNRKLRNMLSVSNLNLKPLRCKETKVSKQKSKYRLSGAYTFNPLSVAPIREISSSTANTELSDVMENEINADFYDSPESSAFSIETGGKRSEWKISGTSHEGKTEYSPLSKKASPVNLDTFNLDDLEYSDFDSHSPTGSDKVDNFHSFLRKSRLNLRETFPEPVTKSKSHDSIFTDENPKVSAVHGKFHNPADMVSSSLKQFSTAPTVEAIYSSGFDASLNFKELSTKLLGDQAKPKDIPDAPRIETPTKKQNYGLFSLLNSPLGSPRGFVAKPVENTGPSHARRDSISKSLTDTFLSFVGNNTMTKPVGATPHKSIKAIGISPPEKIKKMKRDLKDPIAIRNASMSKRLPPGQRQLRNGSHSSLTIGPNKTKIVNHGDGSILKKPTVRRLSQSLLKDALNESLFF